MPESRDRELGRQLSSATAWTFASRVAFAGCGLALNMLLARMVSTDDFGVYLLAVSVISVLIMLGQLGLQVSVVRFVSEAMSGAAHGHPTDVALMCALVSAVGGLGLSILFVGGGHVVFEQVLHAPGLREFAPILALWIGVAVPLGVMAESFRGSRQFKLAALFGGLSSTLIVLFCVLSLYATGNKLGLHLIFSLCAGASAASLMMALFHAMAGRETIRLQTTHTVTNLLRVSLPLMVMSFATLVTTQADLWIAGTLLSKSDVAGYGVAARLVQLVLMPLLVVNAILAPTIAQLHLHGEHRRLERVLGAYAALGALPGIVVLAGFAFVAGPLLSLLFGAGYERAAGCLIVLSLGQLVNCFCGPAATVLMMTGRERVVMLISLGSAVVTVAGGWLLGRRLGLEGVAMAAALAASGHGVACMLSVRRALGIWTFPQFTGWRDVLAVRNILGHWMPRKP